MCPTSSAASASARGGSEGESGAEAGGGDACLEMRKARRGRIVGDGSGSRASERVFRGSVIARQFSLNTKRKGGRKGTYEL